ncbi:MAG: AAA family ATPase [Chloroflexota bacterium]
MSASRREIRVLLVGRTQASTENLTQLIRAHPGVSLVGSINDSSRTITETRNRNADIVIVEAGALPLNGLEVARKLRDEMGGIGVIIVADQTGIGLFQEAMRLGVNDFLVMPIKENEIVKSINRTYETVQTALIPGVPARGLTPEGKPGRGRVVSVVSARGGVGKSLITTSLAAYSAAKYKEKVLLLDLDLQFGNVDLYLGIQDSEGRTIRKLSGVLSELSKDAFEAALTDGPNQLRILLAPQHPMGVETIEPEEVESLLVFVKDNYPLTFIDTTHHLDDVLLLCLRESDYVLLVVTPDLPCIRDTAKLIQVYRDHRYEMNRVRTIINRSSLKDDYNAAKISRTLGCSVLASLPDSPGVVSALLNAGGSVNKPVKAPLFIELRSLAESVDQFVRSRALMAG